ncbi:hypothetical protein [Pontiella desulfatans]|nr:hypothetical protein [Pontiella desulfatans]
MSTRATGGAAISRIDDPTNPGNKVMYLTTRTNGVDHVNGTVSLYANQWFPETALVTMSFDVYYKDGQGDPNDFNDGVFARLATLDAKGFQNDPADPVVYVSDLQNRNGVTSNTWHHIDLVAMGETGTATNYSVLGYIDRDLDPDEIHMYVDGVFIAQISSKNAGNTNDISSICIETISGNGSGNRADLYVDNVVVRDEIVVGSVPGSADLGILSIPPENNVIESFEATQGSSFGPARKADTPVAASDNRIVGQTFTISGTNTYVLDAVTLKSGSTKNLTGASQNLAVAILKDTNADGRGDLQIGSTYTYDVTDLSIRPGAYLSFPLGEGISNVVAGTYQIETYYDEVDADNFGLNWDRNESVDAYGGGQQVSVGSNDGTFPLGDGLGKASNADLTFYVQGRDMAGVLPSFGSFSLSAAAPVTDILESYEAVSNLSSFSSTRITDSPVVNSDNRVLGQSFELSGIAGTATIDAVTMLKPETAGNLAYTNASHTYQLALMKDTNADGKGDLQVGDTYNFEFTGETFTSNETYITFNLNSGITGVVDGVYHVEFYWGEVDPLHTGFPLGRSVNGNGYAAGGQLAKFKNEGTFPVGSGMGNPSAEADLTFFIQGTVDAPADYDSWADGFGLIGSDRDLDADLEPDGMDNLTEYALGGNPNVDDAAAVLPTYSSKSAYIEYVHRERSDAVSRGLDYNVQSTAALSMPAWTNDSTITYVGKGAIDGEFESVTNRLDTASGDAYFIRLHIQQD